MSESPNMDGYTGLPGIRKRQILEFLTLTGMMPVAWLVQIHPVCPVESAIRGPGLVDVFSLVFLPHGFKVILLSLAPITGFLPSPLRAGDGICLSGR